MYNDFCKAIGEFLIEKSKDVELLEDVMKVNSGEQVEEKEIWWPKFIFSIPEDFEANGYFTWEIVATGNVELIDKYFENTVNARCDRFINILIDNKHYKVAEDYLKDGHKVTESELRFAIQRRDEIGLTLLLKFFKEPINDNLRKEAKNV